LAANCAQLHPGSWDPGASYPVLGNTIPLLRFDPCYLQITDLWLIDYSLG
jgi:hypothetical protein